jgi:indole-3-glycerol phosphate synthase
VGILVLSSLQIPLLVSVPHAELKVALTAEERILGINRSRLGSLVQVQIQTTTPVLHPPPLQISTPPPF